MGVSRAKYLSLTSVKTSSCLLQNDLLRSNSTCLCEDTEAPQLILHDTHMQKLTQRCGHLLPGLSTHKHTFYQRNTAAHTGKPRTIAQTHADYGQLDKKAQPETRDRPGWRHLSTETPELPQPSHAVCSPPSCLQLGRKRWES